jgi:hypothetical protein
MASPETAGDLLLAGSVFMMMGALAELLGGTSFRSFFDWRNFPPKSRRGADELRIKIIGFRILLILGVIFFVIGCISLVP